MLYDIIVPMMTLGALGLWITYAAPKMPEKTLRIGMFIIGVLGLLLWLLCELVLPKSGLRPV